MQLETQRVLQDCIIAILSYHRFKYNDANAQNIFNAYIAIYSLRHVDMNVDGSILTQLQRNMELNSEEIVWCNYLRKLLENIDRDPSAWILVTAERCIFETILMKSMGAFGQNLDLIGKILASCLNVDCDAESRLKIFTALSNVFEQKDVYFKEVKDLNAFLQQFIEGLHFRTLR